MAVNGSDKFGHCPPANVHSAVGEEEGVACIEPESTVLVDGIIPTLTALDGDMWANQLLTLQNHYYSEGFNLYFATELAPKVGRVEIVIFNCPEWGISVESIEISVNRREPYYTIFPNTTSCHSLVRLCTDTELSNLTVIFITFTFGLNSSWVHIAVSSGVQ